MCALVPPVDNPQESASHSYPIYDVPLLPFVLRASSADHSEEIALRRRLRIGHPLQQITETNADEARSARRLATDEDCSAERELGPEADRRAIGFDAYPDWRQRPYRRISGRVAQILSERRM